MRRLSWLVWLAPSWLLLAWLFQGVLLGEAFFSGDMVLCFFPLKKYLAQSFAAGAFPDWWPYDALGQPMASLPIASMFHPTTLLYLLLPFKAAWSLQSLSSVFLAPLGTWFFARTLGLKRPAAAFATAIVAVSFWHVLLASQTQMHLAAASLPWFWREAIRVFRSRRGSVVVLALATANMAVGGDPMLMELALIGLVPLLRWSKWRRPHAWARLTGAGLLGAALGAVQLVPMLYVFPHSPRSAGLNISVDDLWALRGSHLPAFIWPTRFGSDLLFDSLYVGVPVFVFAALGLATKWRLRWPLLITLCLLVVTAIGRAGPLWHVWSALLPGWSGYQFPVKTLGPAVLPLAMLAGRGLQSSLRRFAWPTLVLGGIALLVAGLATAVLHVAAGALGFLLERRSADSRRLSSGVAVLVTLLLCTDIALIIEPAPTRPFEVLETPPPLMQALQQSGVGLTGGFYEWSYNIPPGLSQRVPDWKRYENELMLLVAAPASGGIFGLPSSRQYLAGVTRRVFEVSRASREQDFLWRVRLSQAFGANARVQLFTSPLPLTTVGSDAELGAAVVRLPEALPRAYVAFAATPIAEAQQVARLSTSFQPGREVVVAPEHTFGLPSLTPESRALQAVSIARNVDVISADVALEAAGLLVLNEAWAPGWRVEVDGQPAQLVPANHAVMGVPLSVGAHRVVFTYETPGLVGGLAVSASAALVLLVWVAMRRRHAYFARRAR